MEPQFLTLWTSSANDGDLRLSTNFADAIEAAKEWLPAWGEDDSLAIIHMDEVGKPAAYLVRAELEDDTQNQLGILIGVTPEGAPFVHRQTSEVTLRMTVDVTLEVNHDDFPGVRFEYLPEQLKSIEWKHVQTLTQRAMDAIADGRADEYELVRVQAHDRNSVVEPDVPASKLHAVTEDGQYARCVRCGRHWRANASEGPSDSTCNA